MKKINTRFKVATVIVLVVGVAFLMLNAISAIFMNEKSNLSEKEMRTVQACWPAYTFETAVEEASTIIHGKVVDISDTLVHVIGTAGNGSVLRECYKEITVEVIEGIKGIDDETASITFIQSGGETEDYVYVVTGIVPVEMGEEYLFFINEKGSSLSPSTLIPVEDGIAQTTGKIAPTVNTIQQTLTTKSGQGALEEYDLKQYIMAIREELSRLLEEKVVLNNDLMLLAQKIENFHMEPPETRFYEAISENKYMIADSVTLRKMPCDSEEFYTENTLSYYMVTPIAVVFETVVDLQDNSWTAEDRHWVLVSYHAFGDWIDSYGWVKFSELIEYNEETINLLQGPFMLSEDAIDIETGELAHELLRGSWVSVDFEEDYVRVGTDGGIFCKVDKKYLIYPEYK